MNQWLLWIILCFLTIWLIETSGFTRFITDHEHLIPNIPSDENYHFVGGSWWLSHPKNMTSSVGMIKFPIDGKNVKCSKGPTRFCSEMLLWELSILIRKKPQKLEDARRFKPCHASVRLKSGGPTVHENAWESLAEIPSRQNKSLSVNYQRNKESHSKHSNSNERCWEFKCQNLGLRWWEKMRRSCDFLSVQLSH